MRNRGNVLVTGGCGFIGTAFIHYLAEKEDFNGKILNVDKLTYAGNGENHTSIQDKLGGRYRFFHTDIIDTDAIRQIIQEHEVSTLVHFAAESHVDRSIVSPGEFIQTNIVRTFSLLEAAKSEWGSDERFRFHHISTDEVYGSLGESGSFKETTPYDPKSPYSASKAASDHLVRSYGHTFGINNTISNCSNNYGPWQFPEKLIPLMINNMKSGLPLPVYGEGTNVRDWLYVMDHVKAIDVILTKGISGESYNIGGDCEKRNIDLLHSLIEEYCNFSGSDVRKVKEKITFVTDRPGHDFRYAIDHSKITKELGWSPSVDLETGLKQTVKWYLENDEWIEKIKSGEYRLWVEKNYQNR